jgi:hypothetical protein
VAFLPRYPRRSYRTNGIGERPVTVGHDAKKARGGLEPSSGLTGLQQLPQLVAADAGATEDAGEGAGLDIAVVVGHGNHLVPVWVGHDVVAATDAIKLPAPTFEGADELLWLDRRELVAHGVATTTRSCSAGFGVQPRSRMASR